MKKALVLAVAFIAVAGIAFAQVDLAKVKDGVYFAQEKGFSSSGWREQVVLEVSKVRSSAPSGTASRICLVPPTRRAMPRQANTAWRKPPK